MMPRLHIPAFLAAVLLLVPAGRSAAEPAGATFVGSGFTGTPFQISGDFVAESDSLMETVRDFSQPGAPRLVGLMSHDQDSWLIETVHDDGLLVGLTGLRSGGIIGFSLFDVADLSQPQYLGTISGLAFESASLHGRALLASSNDLLVTYDLSTPLAPQFTTFLSLAHHAGSRWPSTVGDVLYQIESGAILRALDISDAYHPASLGLPVLGGDRIDALAGGDGVLYALVAADVGQVDERLDLVTCRFDAPSVAIELDRVKISDGPGAGGRSLIRSGDLLVAATADGKVKGFGLGDPTQPAFGWELAHDCSRLVVTPSALLIRQGRDLFTYARTPWNVTPTDFVQRGPLKQLAAVAGEGPLQVAQLYWHRNQLVTVDLSEPALPRLGEPITLSPPASGLLTYADGMGLVSQSSAGRLVDLSNPAQPVEKAAYYADDWRGRLRLVSRELLIVENPLTSLGLQVVDIGDAGAPMQVSTIAELYLRGAGDGLLVAGDGIEARLYDISDVADPRQLGSLADPGEISSGVFWRGHFYAATTRSGVRLLEAWDVGNPSAPTLVSSLPMALAPARLDLHGSRLYAQAYRHFQVFDLAIPAAPVAVTGSVYHHSPATGFATNGNLTTVGGHLITVRNDGLSPAATPPPAQLAVRLDPAWPNPFNPSTRLEFVTESERELTLSVYDVRGHRLAELARGRFAAGRHDANWDGTDEAGMGVAAGVYLVRLHGPGVEAVRTVTLIK